jgi:16S rRNA processing protein RimM
VVDHRTQTLIGTVTDIFSAGHDLLEVQLHRQPPPNPGKKRRRPATVLIPFVEVIVPVVDLVAQRLEVLPPIGLLDTPDSGAVPPEPSPDD